MKNNNNNIFWTLNLNYKNHNKIYQNFVTLKNIYINKNFCDNIKMTNKSEELMELFENNSNEKPLPFGNNTYEEKEIKDKEENNSSGNNKN